jgi:hypothetical protein
MGRFPIWNRRLGSITFASNLIVDEQNSTLKVCYSDHISLEKSDS